MTGPRSSPCLFCCLFAELSAELLQLKESLIRELLATLQALRAGRCSLTGKHHAKIAILKQFTHSAFGTVCQINRPLLQKICIF